MDEMTTDEFREAVGRDPVVILPLGATEAHGPHLPLGTDTFQPVHVAEAVAGMMPGIIVAPAMPYGQHSSTKDMPGTLGISFDTLRSFVTDVLESLIDGGIKRIVVMSGHAGASHMCAVTEACRSVVKRKDAKIVFFSDYEIAYEKMVADGDGHGGMLETSRIMDIEPDLVRKARPVGEYKGRGYLVLKDASECLPSGMAGDTSLSSARFGKEVNDYIAERVSEIIRRDLS